MAPRPLDHLALLRTELDGFIDAVAGGPPDAPVAGCPGWGLADLGAHLGDVHRWVLGTLADGPQPPLGSGDTHEPPPGGLDVLAAWLREGADRLLTTLAALDPASPAWHPFPVEPKVAGIWPRRQLHEAVVHRWDAQHAAGHPAVIDPVVAADGVDEYWTVMLPRMLIRTQRRTPATTLAVELTDVADRIVVDGSTGLPAVLPSGVQAPATLSGPAAQVLLRLWGRPADGVAVEGDPEVAAAWLALGGN